MPFTITPEMLVGPASGLVIALIFAFTFYKLFLLMMKKHEELTNQLIRSFEAEIEGCNQRYKQVFDELLRIKEKTSA